MVCEKLLVNYFDSPKVTYMPAILGVIVCDHRQSCLICGLICARWLRYHAPWRMMCSPSGALYRAPHYRGIAITFGDIRGWSRGFRRNLLRAGIHAHKSPGLSGFEWFAEENQQYCLYFRRSWFLLCSSGGTLGWAKNRKLLVLFKPKILAFIKIAFEFDYRIIGCKNGSQ